MTIAEALFEEYPDDETTAEWDRKVLGKAKVIEKRDDYALLFFEDDSFLRVKRPIGAGPEKTTIEHGILVDEYFDGQHRVAVTNGD